MPRQPPATLSWEGSLADFARGARRLGKRLVDQVRDTPAKLQAAFRYNAPGQLTGSGQGMQGVSATMTRGARGLREVGKQVKKFNKGNPSVTDLAR